MIHVVFDTNIVISGYLWFGAPYQAINAISERKTRLLTSESLVDELKDVISRPKFKKRLEIVGKTAEEVVAEFLKLAEIIEVETIPPTIIDDPDDDMVLACAVSGKAELIVSGDPHLLEKQNFRNIPIVTVNTFLERMKVSNDSQ